MCSTPLTELIVRCYPGKEGANNTYILYEDDGLTQDYLQGKYATTRLNYQKSGGQTIITVSPVEGTYEGQPRKRAYRIELPGIPVQARVSVNGKKARTTPNQELNGVIVPIKVMDIHKPIVIKYNNNTAFSHSPPPTKQIGKTNSNSYPSIGKVVG